MTRCLALLRQADEIVMEENELAIAVHLSRAIEDLVVRIDQEKVSQCKKPA
jgi:hypothetical protein